MRLLKCYIENFGKLHNFSYEFKNGFNEIVAENGFGKTTFAVFVKSMFYGVYKNKVKGNLEENDRKKYAPWQGGAFGGNLEFEIDDKQYRIERFFGSKESDDTFNLINLKTGKPSKDYSKNIGEEIFGLDAEAYERSVYIPQKEIDKNINESLSNRLTGIIHGTDNFDSLDKAIEILDKRKSNLKNRQNNGIIPNLEQNIKEIEYQIDDLKNQETILQDLLKKENEMQIQIAKLTNDKEKIELDISDCLKVKQQIANRDRVADFESEINKIEKAIKNNNQILNNEVLTESDFDVVQKDMKQFQENSIVIKTLSENNGSVKNKFDDLKKSDLDSVNNKLEKINPSKQQKIKTKMYNFVYLSSILTFVFSFLFFTGLIFSKTLVIIGASCALVFALLSAVLFILKKKNGNAKKQEIKILENDVKLFIEKYGSLKNDLGSALNEINIEYFSYMEMLNNQKNIDKKLETLNKKNEEIKQNIEQFFAKFELYGEEYESGFNVLKNAFLENKNMQIKLKEIKDKVDDLQKNINIDNDLFTKFEKVDVNVLQNESKALQHQIDNLKADLSKIKNSIILIEENLSILEFKESELEKLCNEKTHFEFEKRCIDKAKEFLMLSKDDLSAKYLAPMKNSVVKYLNMLTNSKNENVNIDTNINVMFSEYGKLREAGYLSKGYQSLVNMCIRLALVDAIFDKQKPFIVLDDPFVNFDEQKLNCVLNLIKDVSKNYQVIYFVCHNSRA